ncbi:uncharacterized protein N7506_010732 [Penicillium brevicompactum]|uniref:uncharacterized protein n=1 Tax=Penicillium brevicompactum TaxID=5074 RepID=UPI00254068D1|nr:uncharacterized protein N7506_010732 [Penicillium brevicompactum]KAJ5327630.1 hypothetical protein N7506_010732 [Penicillium brevicompactum]
MPPIRSQTSKNSAEQEGRILLAIQAIKKQEIATIALAARTFNILLFDDHGVALRSITVREIANILFVVCETIPV